MLNEAEQRGMLTVAPSALMNRVTLSSDFATLRDAEIVIESTVESPQVKRKVIRQIEKVVSVKALIGSNTSAIPVTELQAGAMHPERLLGLHWAEPANITRFMEIICGQRTSRANAKRAETLARGWGKEPSVLLRDIRGFISNRIMYAMLREAFHLVDEGYATVADVDRSLRNDLGYWITFAGPFRFMDLTGIPAYAAVMKDLSPELNRGTAVPRLMKRVRGSGGLGVANGKGFYSYTPAQARRWETLFIDFTYKIRELADDFPEDAGDQPKRRRK